MLRNLKQFSLPDVEKKVLRFWRSDNTFQKSLKKNPKTKRFRFFEGPPTANGRPGIHHVLSRAFKDVILRYKTMRGYHVLRKAGWDTHGLPVEIEIEKELGLNSKPEIEKYGIAKFNRKARESVWKYKTEWEKLTERVGFWIDFDDPYITYETKYVESLWWIIKEIHKQKLLYKGHRVAPWCPRCGTALSSHEMALGYKPVKETSVYIKFQMGGGQKVGKNFVTDDKTYILSWTTTPWTFPGNVGLAVGGGIKYLLVETQDSKEKLIVAENLANEVLKDTPRKIIATLAGRQLVGLCYEQLFDIPSLRNENTQKIYDADFVTTTDGTGIVHTSAMYGEDDYQLGVKVGMPQHHTVLETGHFTDEVPGLEGLSIKAEKTEQKILAHLKNKGYLFSTKKYEHDYPHCWRCSTPLLYYARESWFVAMSKLKKELIAANKKINWVPAHVKGGRFGNWLEEVKDWNFSRERYWGTPLPVWKHTTGKCKHYLVIGSLKDLDKYAWKKEKGKHNWPVNQKGEIDVHRPRVDGTYLKCPKCGGKLTRVKEIVDGWFDSGSMPFAQWHYPFENKSKIEKQEQFPADYIVEGVDQTRGWFYTLLAVSVLLEHKNPYENVISLGLILDKDGLKMSKSKGNIVDPWEMSDTHGADTVRWHFFTASDPGEPKRFDENDLRKVSRRLFTILYNSYVFLNSYEGSGRKGENTLDKWIVARLHEAIKSATQNLDGYNIFKAGRALESFVDDLSRWYIRRSRKDPSLKTLSYVLAEFSKVLAPFAPFFSEALYQSVKTTKQSVHLTDWPKGDTKKINSKLLGDMAEVRRIASLALSAREEEGIRVRQPLNLLVLKSQRLKGKKELLDLLMDEVNVKEITFDQKLKNDLKLDVKLTSRLKAEGNLREIVRLIQGMRRDAKLTPRDKIIVVIRSADKNLSSLIERNEEGLKNTVNAKSVNFRAAGKTTISVKKKIDGKSIEIGIRKV